MQIWNKHTTQEILQTLEMELAKTQAELRCAETDIQKSKNSIVRPTHPMNWVLRLMKMLLLLV